MVATSRIALGALAGAAIVFAGVAGWRLTHGQPAPAPALATPPDVAADTGTSPSDALEAAVRQHPQNADAWLALGNAQISAERFAASAASFRKAAALAPDRAEPWSALGEALAKASPHDPLPPDSLAAFRHARTIDPKDPRARYYLAVRRDLDGDHRGAINDWFALLKDTPTGAPWEHDLRRTIVQVAQINKIDVSKRLAATPAGDLHPGAGAAIPGPTAEQMQAASSLTPSQQQAMVAGMVGQLEARLAADPSNTDGWVMLMRSRMQLGEPDKASAALKAGVKANPGAAAQLQAAAAALGVPVS